MREQAAKFVEQAKQSIQSGQLPEALNLVEQAIALEPASAEAYCLRGVVLSQLQRPVEATDSFSRAISLNPAFAKGHYNLAVHLFAIGNRTDAIHAVREAVRLEPSNVAAVELLAQVEPIVNPRPPEGTQPDVTAPPPIYTYVARPGYETPTHSMQFVERLGNTWTIFGWVISAVGLIGFVLGLIGSADTLTGILNNEGNFESLSDVIAGENSAGGLIGNLLLMLTGLFGWAWAVVDIIDRRANWVWVVPFVVCCCLQMHWLSIAIYMLAGRKAT